MFKNIYVFVCGLQSHVTQLDVSGFRKNKK